ncbi:flagellar export protein FliJ [Leadbettera azotonutricia]|uniref:Flagellar FliJ protein n=1 Tax=Leadbettera azotonutricia (strain ATCC BAA-888 / DSM 13862 / ZAS-9) TaxID=545695 RepID=F5Y8Z6_LEAAZ|nr:flagellar export protein FliJ [Leadbettera azotonutricia]AEF83437.1 flagellar export protein FliJ [Leadbettera azotonutricia ZAS-9]
MKRFSFNLEKVLTLRKFAEQEAKIELGRAVGVLSEIERHIVSVAQERFIAASNQFSPENSAAMIQQYMFYLLRLDATRDQLLKDAAQAELKVEQAREVFLEASRDRKVLDKLKEKRAAEYRKEMLDAEGKALDDIASGRLARQLADA